MVDMNLWATVIHEQERHTEEELALTFLKRYKLGLTHNASVLSKHYSYQDLIISSSSRPEKYRDVIQLTLVLMGASALLVPQLINSSWKIAKLLAITIMGISIEKMKIHQLNDILPPIWLWDTLNAQLLIACEHDNSAMVREMVPKMVFNVAKMTRLFQIPLFGMEDLYVNDRREMELMYFTII